MEPLAVFRLWPALADLRDQRRVNVTAHMTTAAIIHMGMRKPIFTSRLIAPFSGAFFTASSRACSFIEGLMFVKLLIHPAELSAADRASQTARRKAIYEELHPETAHGATGGGHDRSRQVGDSAERFTANTAAAIGKSERVIQRDAERGEKVCAEAINVVRGTCLDTGVYFDKLKNVDPEKQVDKARRLD